MEWVVTLSVVGVSLVLTLAAAWLSGRPRKDSMRTPWISWRFVTLIAGAVMLLGLVHAMNLMGLQTGAGMPGGPSRP